jgi:hypothetical protein
MPGVREHTSDHLVDGDQLVRGTCLQHEHLPSSFARYTLPLLATGDAVKADVPPASRSWYCFLPLTASYSGVVSDRTTGQYPIRDARQDAIRDGPLFPVWKHAFSRPTAQVELFAHLLRCRPFPDHFAQVNS